MRIVFAEYRIDPAGREPYLAWAKRMAAADARLTVYEGSEQPGLFVEIWHGLADEEYEALRRVRLEADGQPKGQAAGRPAFEPLGPWVPGGSAKVHVWSFEKVT